MVIHDADVCGSKLEVIATNALGQGLAPMCEQLFLRGRPQLGFSDLSDRSDLSDAFTIRITTAPPEGFAGLLPLLGDALPHRLAAVGAGW